MTAHVLVCGQLFRVSEQRTSKAGKPFVTATIRGKDGDASQWWKGRCHVVEKRTREFCISNIFKRPRLPRATFP